MTTLRYRPGPWIALAYLGPLRDGDIAVATDGAVLLVPPGTDGDLVDRLWASLGNGDVRDPDDLLRDPPDVHEGVLLQLSGTAVTPVIRGEADVTVSDVADTPAGRTVTVQAAVPVGRDGDGGSGRGPGAGWLPLRAGVVGVSTLQIVLPAQQPTPSGATAPPAPVLADPPAPPSNPPTIGLERPTTGPVVLARVCPDGHANPPAHRTCDRCGAGLDTDPRQVARPSLGTVRFADGRTLDLTGPLVIGRQPTVSRGDGTDMPRAVTVPSRTGDISRSHVRVRLDGWHVLLDDLDSTNGTLLRRPGQSPRRLGRGETTMILDQDVVDLGDGVSFRFEGLR